MVVRQAGGLREASSPKARYGVGGTLAGPPVSRAPIAALALLYTLAAAATAVGQPANTTAFKYPWDKGDEVAYSYTIDTRIDGKATNFKGTCNYRPRKAADADLDRRSGTATGTAFVVNSNGYLVTCDHVVRGGTQFTVKVGNDTHVAKVLQLDRECDLALIQIPASGLPVLPLGDSKKVELAQEVRVVGFPLSDVLGNSIKITSGSVAGVVEHEGQRLFQVDAAINPGNSGGPVVNNRGEVIGVASAKLAGSEISNVGFAVSVEKVRALLGRQGVVDPLAGARRRCPARTWPNASSPQWPWSPLPSVPAGWAAPNVSACCSTEPASVPARAANWRLPPTSRPRPLRFRANS